MVKHNNVVPNVHCHKKWQRRVKTWFDQPAKKKNRRLARKAKAAKLAPRPVSGLLRPVVHCSTQKYSSKTRLGRGFSLAELKEAGIPKKVARTIGIAVDHRRTNKSVEAMQANIARLAEFKARLVVFPRKSNQKPKNGDSAPEETSQATQLTGPILPIVKTDELETAAVTDEMKNFKAFTSLRLAKSDARVLGLRASRAAAKAKE
uniref:60S ribosomal protein L13 n=1 Tax=Fibrocapsa japonica TaxID=94617 RepID=A0A7S2UYA0_9STRA|mmetsp:Transcript_19776/g.28602  ORF Transcript_19776/g.28602 Transcript_19776/m.28602 type:complete len:205 (+) Transcript_19776:77-691(+)|eukprot:CAMPEP_0113935202 /NCGR_PEP_ID=MMETSP1339-20121228/2391_1 /TAXON_ID=94617 /ORGANISM="Fibrocapsa japonica" /LENGTH=204 /DNA_ID=CAMNT_0000937269 /DNA_START=72 /DNA_END=686 /DNA_ORIENTATION=- /assembly_acc=CAM_ASM_000762